MEIGDLRREYRHRGLDEAEAGDDPLVLFGRWFDDAIAREVPDANAMALATVGLDGQPSSRIVLLKGWDERGFVFYTNRASRKGRELAREPRASLLFYWQPLSRQVRIDGIAEVLGDDEADAYFATRPRDSQLSALASHQSEPIPDRAALEAEFERLAVLYEGRPVPRPPSWGGYRVAPSAIEFWQGRPSRLHDRFLFERLGDGSWRRTRLAP